MASTLEPPHGSSLQELIAVVSRLRDPEGGCPWDLAQTHQSLLPYVLEEAHEVADAIRHGDDHELCEELGDLLLQVVLHAQIASEQQRFTLEDVGRAICDKLVRRHPHVFGDAQARDNAQAPDIETVRQSWEAIKAAERAMVRPAPAGAATESRGSNAEEAPAPSSPLSDRLARQVRGQPSLAGAMTISRQAAAAGFEWEDITGVWEKVEEELAELKQAIASGDRTHAQEELGDVLFTLVNVARWCGVDPEEGLAGTNHRFLDRFSRVERALGGDLGGRDLRDLEGMWQQAKAAIRAESLQRTPPETVAHTDRDGDPPQ